MKKLFTLIILCVIAMGVNAQSRTLNVDNRTGCVVYFKLLGGPANCLSPFTSATIFSAPPGVTSYTNASADIGFTGPGGNYYGAIVYSVPVASGCPSPTQTQVGDGCVPYPFLAYLTFKDTDPSNLCGTCGIGGLMPVLWIAATAPTFTATLQLN